MENNAAKREMTLEEEQEGIRKYQELKNQGLLSISNRQIGDRHPLAEVLPMTCEEF